MSKYVNALYQRRHRERVRQKAAEAGVPKKPVMTAAERSRLYRKRKRENQMVSSHEIAGPSTIQCDHSDTVEKVEMNYMEQQMGNVDVAIGEVGDGQLLLPVGDNLALPGWYNPQEYPAVKPEPEESVDYPLPHVEVVACPLDIEMPSASQQVNQFCRLCLRDLPSLFPLMSRVQDVLVPDMVETVTGIHIDLQDSLPKKLCIQCLTKLDYAYHIREEFIQSNRVLKDLAKSKTNSLFQNLVEYQNGLLATTETYAEKLLDQNRDIIRLRLIKKEEQLTNSNCEALIQALDQVECFLEPAGEGNRVISQDSNESSAKIKEPQGEQVEKRKKMRRYNLEVKEEKLDPDRCYICMENFTNANDLAVHLSDHVDMIPYECQKCTAKEKEPQIMVSLIMLHRHFRMHASSIKCPECSFRTCTAAGLYAHMQRRHNELSNVEYDCGVCGLKMTNKKTYDRHLRMHKAMDEGRYACKFCEKRFATKTRVTRHERSHTNERPYQCRYCPKAFTNGTSFHSHERTHTGEKGHRCELCGKTFRTKTNLKGHVDSVHEIPGQPKKVREPKNQNFPEPVKCELEGCSFETTNRTKLYSHKAKHELRHHCSHCEERFPSRQRLEQHEFIHTGLKPFCCEICGKNFRFRKSFQEHMDGHSNNRPYSCEVCGSSFVRERTLKEHLLKHSDKMNYECRQCGKKFKYRADQSKHEKTHADEIVIKEEVLDPQDEIVHNEEENVNEMELKEENGEDKQLHNK